MTTKRNEDAVQSGPQNVITGDQDMGMNMPQTQVPEEALVEEKKMAQYSKTAEFKRLREWLEGRVAFFQKYQPNGNPLNEMTNEERGYYWLAANIVVSEFNAILRDYDTAALMVSELEKKNVA